MFRAVSVSHPQLFLLQSTVETRNIFAIAVEQQRRPALLGGDVFLGRLAPARMRHLRIDVGPEAVLGRLQRFPETLRPLVAEAEMVDRLDRLETVLPRH